MNLVIKTGGIKLLTGGPVHLHEQLYRSGGHGLHGRGHEPVLLRPGRGVLHPAATVAELGQSIGVNPVELASMVLIGGTITGLSPISTTGGLIMATLMADESGTAKKDEEMKLFMELTGWALGILVVLTLLAGVGFYNLIF